MIDTLSSAKRGLVVLGMHRSGTSCMAGLLVRLGGRGPATLMPADRHNAAGYWESNALVPIHERLLQEAGSHWSDWRGLDPDWAGTPQADSYVETLRSACEVEFGDAQLFVMKDPRVSRFVPLWLRVLERVDARPVFVIMLRNAYDVAASLTKRDCFDPDDSLLLWLRHTIDAELATRNHPRSFVRYERLLSDPVAVGAELIADLEFDLSVDSATAREEIAAFVQAPLCHHSGGHVEDCDTRLRDWVQSTDAALDEIAGGSATLGHEMIDDVRKELDAQTDRFRPIDPRLLHTTRIIDTLRSEAREKTYAPSVLERQLETLAAQLTATAEQLRLATDKLVTLDEEQEKIMGEITEARRETSEANQHLTAILNSRSWRITAPLRAVWTLFGSSR
jgi:hypothetical protein